jgi:hypothetical protein
MADNGWSVVDVSPVASGDDAWGVVSTAPAQDHPLDFSRITNEPVGARAKRAWNYLTSYAPGERKLSDVPLEALKNAPGSAGDLISNLYTAVAHPLTTVNTIADVGAGALRNVAKNVLPGSVFNAVDSVQTPGFLGGDNGPAGRRASNAANAVGEMLADRYGGWSNIKNTAATDPVGLAADVAGLLSGGGGALRTAGGTMGRVGETISTAGRAMDPVALMARGASAGVRGVANAASVPLGLSTGTGPRAVMEAYNAGREGNPGFVGGMLGTTTAKDLVADASDALLKKFQDRGDSYVADIAGLRGSQATLDTTPIKAAMAQAKSVFTGQNGFVKDAAAESVWKNINDKVTEWRAANPSPTPLAFDDLKQSIGAIRDADTKPGSRAFRVADSIYGAVDNQLKQNVPGYQQAMRNYASSSDNLRQLQSTLSLKGGNTNVDTAARKLQSALRDNVNTNFGERARLVDQLNEINPTIVPTIAGMAMKSPLPRGLMAHALMLGEGMLAGHGALPALLALPLASPMAVGSGMYGLGRGLNYMGRIPLPAVRAAQQGGRLDNLPGLLGQ